jgi:hypothetical protein
MLLQLFFAVLLASLEQLLHSYVFVQLISPVVLALVSLSLQQVVEG